MQTTITRTTTTTKIKITLLLGLGIALCLVLLWSGQQAEANIPTGPSSAQSAHIGYKGYVGKVERSVLDNTSGGKSTQFIVLLSQQADLSQAYSIHDQDQRGWFVYNSLRSTADRSQAPLKQSLDARGIPYKSFWAANMLLLTGDRSLVDTLSARADVRAIESNLPFSGINDPVAIHMPSDNPNNPHAIEWGVQNVQAPQVWAMGFTGQNIVIANQDTGMRWSHNAIKPKYRGWNGSVADHNYNWWDAVHSGGGSCGPNTAVPCDDHGHGTHTTGTTVGDDGAGNQVGVSPGSKWIGCRNMNVGVGTPSSYTECFQFFLAPTDLGGNNPNPALRPHVMNNSWGCPTSEGCAPNTLQQIVENTQASGIFVEASAGNSGSSCGSVTDPPAIYAAAFSTGAIDISNNLASFSSRGPVTVDGSNRMKPNISAPGVNVRSSTVGSDTSYGSMSGTSMAGPHVAGVVALLWSARPELARMITETKALLENTANAGVVVNPVQTCGGIPSSQIPNNSFGYGRVDALAAVNGAGPTSTPTYTVTITLTPTPQSCPPDFSDVEPTDYFHEAVQYLFCAGVISGYSNGTFRPYEETSRGQLCKIIVLAERWTINTPSAPTFRDVPASATFYSYIETAYSQGVISGYDCGTGCLEFRPGDSVTRGQLSKIVVLAEQWALYMPATPTFRDVPTSQPFYGFIETAYNRRIISGYDCGSGCLDFRPGDNATRGQISKIVYQAISVP